MTTSDAPKREPQEEQPTSIWIIQIYARQVLGGFWAALFDMLLLGIAAAAIYLSFTKALASEPWSLVAVLAITCLFVIRLTIGTAQEEREKRKSGRG